MADNTPKAKDMTSASFDINPNVPDVDPDTNSTAHHAGDPRGFRA
jgi:hypothetical protein